MVRTNHFCWTVQCLTRKISWWGCEPQGRTASDLPENRRARKPWGSCQICGSIVAVGYPARWRCWTSRPSRTNDTLPPWLVGKGCPGAIRYPWNMWWLQCLNHNYLAPGQVAPVPLVNHGEPPKNAYMDPTSRCSLSLREKYIVMTLSHRGLWVNRYIVSVSDHDCCWSWRSTIAI